MGSEKTVFASKPLQNGAWRDVSIQYEFYLMFRKLYFMVVSKVKTLNPLPRPCLLSGHILGLSPGLIALCVLRHQFDDGATRWSQIDFAGSDPILTTELSRLPNNERTERMKELSVCSGACDLQGTAYKRRPNFGQPFPRPFFGRTSKPQFHT